MEIDWLNQVILLIILLLLSAFFSGSEVAFFSVKQKNIEEDFKSSKIISRYAANLIAFPRRLLITILVGNTLANVAISIVSVTLALEIAYLYNVTINLILTFQIILVTIIILLFCELLPKVFASKHPNLTIRLIVLPIYLFSLIIYPVSELITEAIRLTFSKIKFDKSKSAITEKEISDLAELGHERGTLEEDEQDIISSFVEFKSVLVSEVMTPRVDMVAVPYNVSIEVLIETINKSGYSRFPVYQESLDKIIGIVHAKDLLPYLINKSFIKVETISKITREVLFVPERKKISDMLKEFQQKKMHLAVVVDEFGGTSGLITLEDIIEEIIGEIWDEHDPEEDAIKVISPEKISVLGKVPITEVNELIGLELFPASDEYDTIAGLIINQAGDIPKEGYSFNLNNYKLTVKEVLKKRIKRIELNKIS
ncbi:MAG: HlyC/CorC family transporter [Ignavibacteriaceae bacterium]|nr:HlyC/CorC family transporter [Ignavibacteriaceae bacterium]